MNLAGGPDVMLSQDLKDGIASSGMMARDTRRSMDGDAGRFRSDSIETSLQKQAVRVGVSENSRSAIQSSRRVRDATYPSKPGWPWAGGP